MALIRIILIILFVVLAATFCTLNRQEITLRYFLGWSTAPFPLFLLIMASLVAGLLVGFSVGWRERWELQAKARDLGKRVKVLKEEVETLTAKAESSPTPATSPRPESPPPV